MEYDKVMAGTKQEKDYGVAEYKAVIHFKKRIQMPPFQQAKQLWHGGMRIQRDALLSQYKSILPIVGMTKTRSLLQLLPAFLG